MQDTERKRQIKTAAQHLFAQKGYDATTMQEIATAVGLKKQSLYTHFESKKSIFADIVRDRVFEFISEIEKTVILKKEEPVEVLLKSIFERLATLFADREKLLLWKRIQIYKSSEGGIDIALSGLQGKTSRQEDFFSVLSKRCPQFCDRLLFMQFYMSYMLMIEGYLDGMLFSPHSDDMLDAVWNNFWNGLRTHF